MFGRQPQLFSVSPHGMGSSLLEQRLHSSFSLLGLTLEVSEFYLPFLLNAKIWAKSKF